MGTVKRLYLYAVAAISLLVLAVGVESLVAVVLGGIADALGANVIAGESSSREQLSLSIALVVVGAPIFAIHWWLIVRGWRGTDQAATDDRHSPIRALYLALVATVSLGFAFDAAQRLLVLVDPGRDLGGGAGDRRHRVAGRRRTGVVAPPCAAQSGSPT